MHHVFVSYSRADHDWVERLAQRIRGAGVAVWIDQQDIPVSLPWFQEVSDAIGAARLFLICDSPDWRRSSSCRAEQDIAERTGKTIVTVAVGEALDAAAAEILREFRRQDRSARLRVELAVLARDWDRAGRPRGALVSRRTARLLSSSQRGRVVLAPTERAFLRASRGRARRRLGIAATAGAVLAACGVGWLVITAVRWNVTQSSAAQALVYARNNSLVSSERTDPIRALAAASALGGDESAANAMYVTRAFSQRVPDDAFKVPGAARRFVHDPVTDVVEVADAAGRTWHRASTAAGIRVAVAGAGASTGRANEPTNLVARAVPRTGAVEVTRGGALWRRIWFRREATALSISPNGRELAAVGGNAIEVADLSDGEIKTTLRGPGDPLLDVAWSSDSSHVWAIGRREVIGWKVRDGVVLRDVPSRHFEAVLPGEADHTAWLVADTGGLEELDVTTGKHLRSIHIPDQIASAAGSADGRVAVVSGRRALWLVSLVTGSARQVHLADCKLGRATLPGDGTAAVPCLGGTVRRVILASGKELAPIGMGPNGAFAVRSLGDTHALLVSSTLGDLYYVAPGATPRFIYASECGGTINRIAASSDGKVVVPVGSGTAINGCTRRLVKRGNPAQPSGWETDSVIDPVQDHLAVTAAVSRHDGIFAFGFGDGTIVLHPTANLIPTRSITTVDGTIRDMMVTPDDQLLVATETGTLTRITLCETCLSNRAMARDAQAVLAREVTLGIARRVRQSDR
jgi:TIR domain